MNKHRKIMCILMGGLAGCMAVAAVIKGMDGDFVGCRLDLAWSVICLMQVRSTILEDWVDRQNDTIGKIVTLIGLMNGFIEVEDEE